MRALLVGSGVGVFSASAGEAGREVDMLFAALLLLSLFITVLLVGLILGFAIRYRAGARVDRSDRIRKSWRWEVGWISGTAVVFFGLFVWSSDMFVRLTEVPAGGRVIYVTGKQWMWKIQHPDGPREINELHVPAGERIKLVLQSQDVVHSFFIPAFRLKQDVFPGSYTTLSFTAERVGRYPLYCAEYCGTEHADMVGEVVVLTPAEFERWYARAEPTPAEERAARALVPAIAGESEAANPFYRYGCHSCHGMESRVLAPRLDGLFGGETKLSNGQMIVVDEEYVRESIYEPNAKIVAGYEQPSLMPTYRGIIDERGMVELIEFLRSIQHGWPAEDEEGGE